MDTRDHIVFSAFFHDIGKLYERAEMLSDYAKDPEKQQLYCPNKYDGYYSHKHVLYTLAFCEKLLKKFPLLDKKYSPDADNNWLNMAARHHIDPQTVEECIVKISDHLASAEREGGNFYKKHIHKKTLLEPLLEKVDLSLSKKDKSPDATKYRIPLKELDSECKNIFPKKGSELGLEGENLLSEEKKLTEDYKKLAEGLLSSIQSLPQYDKNDFESLRALMQSLLYLCERFLVHVPSATNVSSPDISLFDHLKVTSAIAESLYLYHEHHNRLKIEDIKNTSGEEKFLLVCGDFSGIQKFIYNIVSKGATKSLAGRSLYIQFFCSSVSERILRSLELYPSSCIYSSGGKFYLLIPSHLKDQLLKEINQVNQILFQKYQGDVHLSIGLTKMSQEDFTSPWISGKSKETTAKSLSMNATETSSQKISKKFEEVHEDLEKNKNQKFSALINKQPEQFFSANPFKGAVCSICAKEYEPHQEENQAEESCLDCKKFENLGREIRKTMDSDSTTGEEQKIPIKISGLLWLWCEEDYHAIKKKYPDSRDFFDFFITDRSSKEDNFPKILIVSDLEKIKNISFKNSHFEFANRLLDPVPIKGLSYSYRFISSADELNLDEMAKKSKGIKRNGILRMDVDNLAQVFIKGLRKPIKKTTDKEQLYGSLSRYTSLSRQINAFFTGYLNQMAKNQFPNCKVIYAGGDDLFIIGPWDKLPNMAHSISNQFKEYCCYNPYLSLSAGIALIKEKEPVLVGAELAKIAEEQAKNFVRQNGQKKDALCFLDRVIGWEEYEEVQNFKKLIKDVLDETKSKALLQVLYSIEREENLPEKNEKIYKTWRHRFVYYIARLLERTKNREKINELKTLILNESDSNFEKSEQQENSRQSKLVLDSTDSSQKKEQENFRQNSITKTENQYKRRLKYLYMPVCWVDYLNREKQDLKKTG